MKKSISIGLFCLFICTLISVPLYAQDLSAELATIAKNYEKAYNDRNVASLVAFYTMDAERIFSDSRTFKGKKEIAAGIEADFTDSQLMVSIQNSSYEQNPDGSITMLGTYQLKGIAGGQAVDVSGKYTNTLKKVSGKWLISKSSLVSD